MKMRSSSSIASQFGAQEWLIQRASFPPISGLMTSPLSRPKLNVCGSFGSLGASSHAMRFPVYSIMRCLRRIDRVAKTPRPWMGEERTSINGPDFFREFVLTRRGIFWSGEDDAKLRGDKSGEFDQTKMSS